MLAFVIFAIFGIYTLWQGLTLCFGAGSEHILPVMIPAAVVFAGICVWYYLAQRKKAK
jgi:lipopolysaccharide export LptBFGC system permease protein LptF